MRNTSWFQISNIKKKTAALLCHLVILNLVSFVSESYQPQFCIFWHFREKILTSMIYWWKKKIAAVLVYFPHMTVLGWTDHLSSSLNNICEHQLFRRVKLRLWLLIVTVLRGLRNVGGGAGDSMDRSPTETSATQWDVLLCLPGPRHQDVHSHSSCIRALPSRTWNQNPFRASRHPPYIHIKLRICSEHTKFMGHSVKLLFLSGASVAGGDSSTPLKLSWSWLWWACPAPGPGGPGWAGGCCSRSYRRGRARTDAGLALGSSGRSSWRRTRYRSSCRETTDGSLLDSQAEPLRTYSHHASHLSHQIFTRPWSDLIWFVGNFDRSLDF